MTKSLKRKSFYKDIKIDFCGARYEERAQRADTARRQIMLIADNSCSSSCAARARRM